MCHSAVGVVLVVALLFGVAAAHAGPAGPHTTVRAGLLRVGLDASGRIVSLYDGAGKRECLPPGLAPALLTLTVDGKPMLPVACTRSGAGIRLDYGGGVGATVACAEKKTHATFTLTGVTGAKPSRVDWGPLPLTIGDTVGEVVCVARDKVSAVGLQGLTPQVNAAASEADHGPACPHGSRLVAWASEHEGGVTGSSIAVFGCRARDALAAIGAIEVAEGLPHPMLDGAWGKVSPMATQSYLICPYGEASIDDAVALTRKLGFGYLYHPGPFHTWGHFLLNKGEFPNGDESLRRCSERAAAQGIRLGLHTLTAFITTNDPYVTPKPDPRLARLGSSTLAAPIDAAATEIPVADRQAFVVKQNWGWDRRFAVVGDEIVGYGGVSDAPPFRLTGCTRGAFGTKASPHAAGSDIGVLATHGYQTLYPGIEGGMVEEMVSRLVALTNTCGLRQISFDGLEGLSDYGWPGDYTRNRFVKGFYDAAKPEVISDASNLLHYLWHVHTRMNWGEPWGKALREGMPEYRLRNQAFFERNLLPRMMGWFMFQPAGGGIEATTLDDIEWMLSKAAGYDSGFALVSSPADFAANAQGEDVATAMREWEKARHAHAFSARQQERLRDGRSDWHLEAAGPGRWKLWPLSFTAALPWDAAAPAGWQVQNPYKAQPLRFVLRLASVSGEVADPCLEVGGRRLSVPVRLTAGQYVRCEGDGKAQVCDANWHVLQTVDVGATPTLAPGTNDVRLTCQAANGVKLALRVKMVGPVEAVRRR